MFQELTGQVFLEGRAFPGGAVGGLAAGNGSIAIEPEWRVEWGDGRQSLTVVPFLRLDQHDRERSHADIRELTWDLVGDTWEIRAGVRKVFWGVTESTHLVDIVNQTDLVEDLDGEDKLGQPMVNAALIRDWGTIDLFMLLGFRERRFFGGEGRPGLPFPVDVDQAQFESRRGRKRIDWASRWSHAVGAFDLGVSYFHGTSRDPRFQPSASGNSFVPVYDIIDQAGLDLQMTSGGWLWKLEAINRAGQGDRYAAATAGFEYTFGNIATSGIDLGILTEYAFDERDALALTPLENDIFVGTRLALNDVQSTQILAGAAVDHKSGASFLIVEASRRIGDRWTLDVEMRGFVNVPPDDLFLFGIRDDDYVQVSWGWHW